MPLFVEEARGFCWSEASRATRRLSHRPCSNRSPRAFIDSDWRVRLHRSVRFLDAQVAYPPLHDIAELDWPALHASLDRLAEADLLPAEGAPSQANYRFKHALSQAYNRLLKSCRQALHVSTRTFCDDFRASVSRVARCPHPN